MASCERCTQQGQGCSYEVWDKCVSCASDGRECWQPIDVNDLMIITKEWRNIQRDANSLQVTLSTICLELQSMCKELVQQRCMLSDTSPEVDMNGCSQLEERIRATKMSFNDGRREYEELQEAAKEKSRQKQHVEHELADSILKRFEQDCDRCIELDLQQPCTFPENSQCCTACTAAVVRCSGGVNWQQNDVLWHAADSYRHQLDEYLLEKLADASEFRRLSTEEQKLWVLERPYLDRSGLTIEEREVSSQLHTRRLEVRRSLEQIRANSFWDTPDYQRLWSLYEVMTICGTSATRRWNDYDVELNELTGYPQGRNLPAADEMTEEQFRTAVAWVKAHPYYNYDDSLLFQALP